MTGGEQDGGRRPEEEEDEIPQDIPRRLVTQPYDLSVRTLVGQVEDGSLVLGDPHFQRQYVWDDTKASRLIESLLMNVPIPVCYFAEEEPGAFTVIDGQQRIRSIVRFVNNDFRLKGLRVLPHLKGRTFRKLEPRDQRIVNSRTLRCIVITAESHPEIRFDVFERLNTGSVMLSDQELRNCVYRGNLNDLLKELASDRCWLNIMGRARPHPRMQDEELVLRFFALRSGLADYPGALRTFLNNYMREHRAMSQEELDAHRSVFRQAITNVWTVFGNQGFRRIDQRRSKAVNRALFDTIMITFSRLEYPDLNSLRDDVVKALRGLLEGSREFNDAIDRATSHRSKLHTRLRLWNERLLLLGLDTGLRGEFDAAPGSL